MKKNKKQIEKEIGVLRNELNKIGEAEYQKIQAPFLRSLDGKCFVYRDNSYGSGGKWDVFKKVLEIYTSKEGDVYLITEEFQITCNGSVEWKINYHFPYTDEAWRLKIPFSGYEEITNTEYEQEKNKMLGQMASRSELKKHIED